MINIEKLIKSWEIFRDSNPYQICDGKEFRAIKEPEYCMGQMIEDTIALLKEQEPRVMTLDELKKIYVEFKGDNCPIRLTNFDLQKIVEYAVDGECRLWKGKPTDEQRQAVMWE